MQHCEFCNGSTIVSAGACKSMVIAIVMLFDAAAGKPKNSIMTVMHLQLEHSMQQHLHCEEISNTADSAELCSVHIHRFDCYVYSSPPFIDKACKHMVAANQCLKIDAARTTKHNIFQLTRVKV